jgi:hypothetical protein
MDPRFTVSIQTVARSTDGAAGFNLDTPTEMSTTTSSEPLTYMARRIFFFLMTSEDRAMSTINCLCPDTRR